MAPRSWATTEQIAWLQTWMAEFIRRQAEHKLHLFWPAMLEAWVRKWPEHAALGLPLPSDATARALTADELATVGAAIKERKNKLENWFRNQRNKVNRVNGGGPTAASGSTAARIQTMFSFAAPKKHRVHQPVEIFQRRNPQFVKLALTDAGYDALTSEPDEADDFTDESTGTPEALKKSLRSQRMRLRTRVVSALWQDVNDEEKAAVMAEVEKEKAALRKEEEEAENRAERTAAEYQDGIDALDSVFTDVHKAAYKAAGWVGMTIVGGPNPRMDGEMSLKIICFGETPSGNDFEQCCVNFEDDVVKPFEGFVQMCFTAQQCASRSMPTNTATTDAPRLTRIAAIPVAVAAPAAKKSKKRKSKKSPAVVEETPAPPSPSSTSEEMSIDTENLGRLYTFSPEPAANDSSTSADDMDVDGLSADDFFGPSPAGFVDPAASFDTESSPISRGPALCEAEEFLATLGKQVDAPDPRWPAGMTAPLSPEAAAAIAQTERGGMPAGATMAIDPVLEAMTVAPSAGPMSSRPRPRPAYKSATAPPATSPVATVNVDGFNFPLSAPLPATNATPTPSLFKRPSVLFEAFRSVRGSTAASTPSTPRRSSSLTPASTTTAPKGPSKSALFLTSLLGQMNADSPTASTSSTAPTSTAPTSTTPTSTAPTVTASTVVTTASPPIVTSTAANVVTSTAPIITSPLAGPKPFVAPETRPATNLSVAAPKKAPAGGDKLNVVVPSAPTITTPVVAPTPFVAPETRPATSLSVAAPKKAPAKGKPTKGKAANGKKVAFTKADERENAAGVAHQTAIATGGRRGRGRPSTNPTRSVVHYDGEAVERAWANANPVASSMRDMGPGLRHDTLDDHFNAALGEVTNAAPAAKPTVIHSIVSANPALTKLIRSREKAMQAREAEHQRKQEAAKVAAARQQQAAKGWIEDNVDGARVVVLTRARKPAKNADGTEVRVAGMRLTAADVRAREADAKMLKALQNGKMAVSGGKRKADTQSTGATKK
ncbi:hypothetical protein B0H16DRAFT_1741235 [Mycena metata]|uniref:Uncharacterized protein n=1 Tax=Mycena metata TaxID=1033252 RepID=A0AAD7HB34_9AGAR|nr:hypothetical protein B0H16DRAFT_1741235 [Mycena metata]